MGPRSEPGYSTNGTYRAQGGTDGGGTPLSTWAGTIFPVFKLTTIGSQPGEPGVHYEFSHSYSEDDYITSVPCTGVGHCNFHNHTKKIDLQVHRPRSDRPGYGLSNDSGDPPGSHLPRMIMRNAEFRSHSEERRNKHAVQATNYYYI